MTAQRKMLITATTVAALAPPALAGGGGGGGVLAVGPILALVLLGAMPLAVILRTASVPSARLAAEMAEKAFLKRVVGVVVLVLLLLVSGLAAKVPQVAGVLGLIFCAFLLVALAAPARHLGARLFGDEGRGDSIGAFALGWLLLAGVSLLPILGFLVFLYHLVWGIGALVLDLFTGRKGPAGVDDIPENDLREG